MPLSVAILGSGPSGLYAAEGLLKNLPGLQLDILERLPTPFGLIRAGVAPDHQGNKAVARVLAKTVEKPGVRFLGGIEIGRDVTLAQLREIYDAVVVATGATEDRRLGVKGDDLAGVVGSFAFAGWINGHPDKSAAPPLSAKSVVVIGNGNVAIDVARVLVKTSAEMAKSDISPKAAQAIQAAPIEDVHIVGRRGPVDANFTNAELAELGRLERAVALADAGDIPASAPKEKEGNLATLRAFGQNTRDAKPLALRFHFNMTPREILGDAAGRVRAVAFDKGEIACGLVVTAIGYTCKPLEGLAYDARGIVANEAGRVAPGLYVVGWAKRGPSGTIATNRADSFAVADLIAAELKAQGESAKPGPAGFDALGLSASSWADWKRIEAAEIAAATPPAPRRKLTTLTELNKVIGR